MHICLDRFSHGKLNFQEALVGYYCNECGEGVYDVEDAVFEGMYIYHVECCKGVGEREKEEV